eukprot:5904691-Pleurochrysis_carterae.AAC.1
MNSRSVRVSEHLQPGAFRDNQVHHIRPGESADQCVRDGGGLLRRDDIVPGRHRPALRPAPRPRASRPGRRSCAARGRRINIVKCSNVQGAEAADFGGTNLLLLLPLPRERETYGILSWIISATY